MNKLTMGVISALCSLILTNVILAEIKTSDIIHDGEFNFLKAQHGEKWSKEDKEIDKKLADIQ